MTPMTGQNIICFAKDWSEDPTSNNHVMRLLARDNRVLWLNSIATRTPNFSSGRDLQKIGRIEYYDCSDDLALEAFHGLSEREGIIPALESSHALGWLMRNGAAMTGIVVVNLSGRGDKDVPQVAALEASTSS